MSCLFCKIRDGELPAEMVFKDQDCFAIKDLNPQAPMHVLVIPRKHVATLNDLRPEDGLLVGQLHIVAAELAKQAGHHETGYRTVFNCNRGAGQSVFHLHLHLLAGRAFSWPPG